MPCVSIKSHAAQIYITSTHITLSIMLLMWAQRLSALTFPPHSSAGTSRKEITEHWEWLEHNLLQTLSIFENENDITTFVKGKVQVTEPQSKLHWLLNRRTNDK